MTCVRAILQCRARECRSLTPEENCGKGIRYAPCARLAPPVPLAVTLSWYAGGCRHLNGDQHRAGACAPMGDPGAGGSGATRRSTERDRPHRRALDRGLHYPGTGEHRPYFSPVAPRRTHRRGSTHRPVCTSANTARRLFRGAARGRSAFASHQRYQCDSDRAHWQPASDRRASPHDCRRPRADAND